MKRIEALAAWLFGLGFTVLGIAVAIETVMRKVFNQSLQGVDELGGYILAVGAALAFTVALVGRGHIRIDLVHDKLPRPVRLVLNIVATATLALSAVALLAMAYTSFQDTLAYGSVSQTPWATPLKYPQVVWLAALALFALISLAYLVYVLWLAISGNTRRLDERFAPRSSREELQEELDDLQKRMSGSTQGGAGALPSDGPAPKHGAHS